jgi:hypothetical protein
MGTHKKKTNKIKNMKNYNSVTEALLDYYNDKLSKGDFNRLYPKCRFK